MAFLAIAVGCPRTSYAVLAVDAGRTCRVVVALVALPAAAAVACSSAVFAPQIVGKRAAATALVTLTATTVVRICAELVRRRRAGSREALRETRGVDGYKYIIIYTHP